MLRLSVTDRCNFRCAYCMPGDGVPWAKATLPSLERLADAAIFLMRQTNESHVKLTGGEPTLRRGLTTLIERLASDQQVEEVSMTTNASRLRKLAVPLRDAGLSRVNISLDSLDPDRFLRVTGGSLQPTLDGIDAAIEVGLMPVKLNAVLHRSTWREDVPNLLTFAAEKGVELRFIELMQTGAGAEWAKGEFIPVNVVHDWVSEQAEVREDQRLPGETATRWYVNWYAQDLTIGWITPQSHSFCDGCQRIRLDSQGRVRRCLMDNSTFPLLEKLETEPEAAVVAQLAEYLSRKQPPVQMVTKSLMATVGG